MTKRTRALVVFHEHGAGFLSRFLKCGYRHVLFCVAVNGCWVRLEGNASVPVIEIVTRDSFNQKVSKESGSIDFPINKFNGDELNLKFTSLISPTA